MIYDYFNRLTKILIIIHTYRWLGKPSRLILSGFSAVTSSTQILATQNGRLLLHACACAASAYGIDNIPLPGFATRSLDTY